jgi:hypothetical protein
MSELKIGVYSDDNIWYQSEDEDGELGTAEASFLVALPDGTRLPLNVNYGDNGWEFTMRLPEGAHLIEVEDELASDEDDESEEGVFFDED